MQNSESFEYVIGIVGHPTTPDIAWSDQQMSQLKEVGINTLQMNIAWGGRPANEVLNLEDLDNPSQADEWRRRVSQAQAFGFRTLAHFGLPVGPWRDETTCILAPEVQREYTCRIGRFFREFPQIDDILIYTYDQDAWLCSEFGQCPRCQGVPLHERLVPFLEMLVDAVQEAKPGARFWWEPWELSAGQTLAVTQAIRPDHFGLILHHTIAEVQFVSTTDLWFRNLARLAGQRGIPVIGEGFFGGGGEDIAPLTHLACPRLVYQQITALRQAEGVVGMKEYYGFVPAHFSVNIALLKASLRQPHASLSELLPAIAAPYGAAADTVLAAWETTAQAMEIFPWDGSWGLRRFFDPEHRRVLGLAPGGMVPNASWMTPSWQANRRGFYLVTDETDQHPWLREDVGLRARIAADYFCKAADLLCQAGSIAARGHEDLRLQTEDVRQASDASRLLSEHLLSHIAFSPVA